MKEVSDSLEICEIESNAAAEKVIIFAFSGHGTTKGDVELIYADNGETVKLEDEIIFPLYSPAKFCQRCSKAIRY